MSGEVVFVLRALLGSLFLFAASTKITDPTKHGAVLSVLSIPSQLTTPLRTLIPLIETVVAVLLFSPGRRSVLIGSYAATALLAGFSLVVTLLLRHSSPVSCACFGSSLPTSNIDLARNLALLSVAGSLVLLVRSGIDVMPTVHPIEVAVPVTAAVALAMTIMFSHELFILLFKKTSQEATAT